MDKQQYTISEVLKIVKKQLLTIPVSGQNIYTMAAALQNLDVCINTLDTPIEEKDGGNDGGSI